LTKKAAAAIERSVSVELSGIDGEMASLRRTERYAMASAGAIVVVTLVLLLPVGRRQERQESPVMLQPSRRIADIEKETFADLDEIGIVSHATRVPRATIPAPPPPVEPEVTLAPPAPETPIADSADDDDTLAFPPAPAVHETPAVTTPVVSLSNMASLCGDLARVGDMQALPLLLERAASVLDASGLVIWIADPDGHELSPILVHGYPPSVASRLGTLKRDAANLTASAYRTGLLQTIKGDVISDGAVAAPLMSSGGCVGVMAAEVKHGGEQQEELLSAATIIAAQLATLVGPPATRSRAEATG
jgi:hypothetical protein